MKTTSLHRSLHRHLLTALLLGALCLQPAQAEIVVIANSHAAIDKLSREEAINIFMGRYRKLADDSTARPLDLEANSPIRRAFYRQLLDKTLEEVNAYWTRLVFAGRTTPPVETRGVEQMLEWVASNPSNIGYVERSQLTRAERTPLFRNIKVVLVLPE